MLEASWRCFEQFVAVAMESEGLIVSEAIKFPVKRLTARRDDDEWQTHGYEVDLVGARSDLLVLATVKSFFGSRGVVSEHVMGTGGPRSSQRCQAPRGMRMAGASSDSRGEDGPW